LQKLDSSENDDWWIGILEARQRLLRATFLQVHFFGSGIEHPPIGMQYVFRLVGDENRPPLAKELKLDPTGNSKVTAANPFGKIRFVLITLEVTAGRIDRPSENIELTLDAIGLNSTRL